MISSAPASYTCVGCSGTFSGVPTLAAANGSVNVTAHGTLVWPAVTASRHQAAEPADDVAERDARREHVARRPERQLVAPDIPERDERGGDEAAVKHAARSGEHENLVGVVAEVVEVDEEQQQLRADERGDDDVDAEIEQASGVESGLAPAHDGELQAGEIGGRQHDAVRVDRQRPDAEDFGDFKQSRVHVPLPARRAASALRQL